MAIRRFSGNHFPGIFDGTGHVSRISHTLAGYVERRPVIHRGSDDGQSQGDIHSLVEGHQFLGNVALVVIHRNDGIVVPLKSFEI